MNDTSLIGDPIPHPCTILTESTPMAPSHHTSLECHTFLNGPSNIISKLLAKGTNPSSFFDFVVIFLMFAHWLKILDAKCSHWKFPLYYAAYAIFYILIEPLCQTENRVKRLNYLMVLFKLFAFFFTESIGLGYSRQKQFQRKF